MYKQGIDMTGKRFGRLLVIDEAGRSNKGEVMWKCKCDCGNETIAVGGNLRRGAHKSCGCRRGTHGKTGTPLHRVWCHMRGRCRDKNDKSYVWYGARGIKVCEEWREFEPFYAWATKNGYKNGLSIDRIDTNKDYSPDNCKWATPTEQANNRRSNRRVMFRGKKYTVAQLARMAGLQYSVVQRRLYRGLSGEELVRPVESEGAKI